MLAAQSSRSGWPPRAATPASEPRPASTNPVTTNPVTRDNTGPSGLNSSPDRQSIDIASFAHANPIPAASHIGPLLVSSITPPFNPGTRDCPEALSDQIQNLFTHVGHMLEVGGATWDDVAKMTFYVADPAESRKALNGPWLERFPDERSRPARHNLQAVPNDGPLKISCDFIAYVTEDPTG